MRERRFLRRAIGGHEEIFVADHAIDDGGVLIFFGQGGDFLTYFDMVARNRKS